MCGRKVTTCTEKSETLDVVGNVMELRKCTERFNLAKYKYEMDKDGDAVGVYSKMADNSLEDGLARFAIFVFSLANSYKMNVQSLREGENGRDKSFDEFIYSLLKISMSHYRSCKKIIILIGMLCGYCDNNNIDLSWYIGMRLSAGLNQVAV